MRRFILKNIMELSGAIAAFGICGLAIIAFYFPQHFIAAPAFAFGWFVGTFHGVYGEMEREKQERENDR